MAFYLSSLFGRKKSEDKVDVNCCEQRRKPRHKCEINSELMDSSGRLWSCKIVDMSEVGIGIYTPAELSRGYSLNIVKPNIKVEVLWSRDNRAGLRPIEYVQPPDAESDPIGFQAINRQS